MVDMNKLLRNASSAIAHADLHHMASMPRETWKTHVRLFWEEYNKIVAGQSAGLSREAQLEALLKKIVFADGTMGGEVLAAVREASKFLQEHP